jgi:epoxyqueuosine reductase
MFFYLCEMLRYQDINKYATEAGFTLCGVARARVLTEQSARFEGALAASGDEALGYLVRRPERRFDPSTLLPGAKTVVVCAVAYDPRAMETPRGRVSAHRRDGDYQPRVKAMLSDVLTRLRADFPALDGKVCCDTSAILEKAWAVEAGLGWIGRNSLLINPEHGSFLLLGELILDDECDLYDTPLTGVGCGGCRRCIEVCPTGALVINPLSDGSVGSVDTRRCISALTIEKARKGVDIEPISGWILGCDECQNACPRNITASKRKKVVSFF